MLSRSKSTVAVEVRRAILLRVSVAALAAFIGFGSTVLAGGCGCEGVCDCEPVCGAEPACGLESPCGCEPACGLEPQCGLEPACGCEAGCTSCSSRGCDGGLLGCNPLPKSGPVFKVLDGVAGGLEKILHLNPKAAPVQRCACQSCGQGNSVMHATPYSNQWQSGPTPVQSSAPLIPMHPKTDIAPHVPTLSSPGPLPTPRPIPMATPSPTKELPRPAKPAVKPFDTLNNPFEDDSATRISRQPKLIQPASHDEDQNPVSGTFDDVDYDDYFR